MASGIIKLLIYTMFKKALSVSEARGRRLEQWALKRRLGALKRFLGSAGFCQFHRREGRGGVLAREEELQIHGEGRRGAPDPWRGKDRSSC